MGIKTIKAICALMLLAIPILGQSLSIIKGPMLVGTGTTTGGTPTYKNHPDPSCAVLGTILVCIDGENLRMFDNTQTPPTIITTGGIGGTGYPIDAKTFWQNFAGTFTGTCLTQSCGSEPQVRWIPSHTLGIANADSVTDPEDRVCITNAVGGGGTTNAGPWIICSGDTTHVTDLSTWKAKQLALGGDRDYDGVPTISFKKNVGFGVGWENSSDTTWGISLFTWANILFTSGNIGSFQNYTVGSGGVFPEFYGGTTSYGTDSNDLYLVRQTWAETGTDGTEMTYRVLRIPPPSGTTFSPALVSGTLSTGVSYFMLSGSNIAQKNSSTTIRTRDGYHLWDVAQTATALFFSNATMQSSGGAGLSGVQWFRVALSSVQSGSPTVADSGNTFGSGKNFMYAQAGVDSNGTLFLTGTDCDSTTFCQLEVYWRLASDTAGTLRGPTTIQAGSQATTCNSQSPWSAVGLYHQSFPLATDMTQMLVTGVASTNVGNCAWTWYTATLQATLGTTGGSASVGNAAFSGNKATR